MIKVISNIRYIKLKKISTTFSILNLLPPSSGLCNISTVYITVTQWLDPINHMHLMKPTRYASSIYTQEGFSSEPVCIGTAHMELYRVWS